MLNLRPGRAVGDRELAGIRHLVASAVSGLRPDTVTIVDEHGTVLTAEGGPGEAAAAYERKLERDLEARLVSLLEPAVGAGAIVARVDAAVDASEVDSQAESFDPDSAVLRSERKVTQAQSQESGTRGGIAGAAANVPLALTTASAAPGPHGASNLDDQTRNFEVSKTVTRTVVRSPRLRRLSIAILVDGVDGKPRPEPEILRLGELAKRAAGFDAERGDQFEISSAPFSRSADEGPSAPLPSAWTPERVLSLAGPVLGAVVLLAAFFALLRRRPAPHAAALELLRPGARVAEIEAARAMRSGLPGGTASVPALPGDPNLVLRDRARDLAAQDPTRAVHLLRAWMQRDTEDSLR